MTNAEKLALIFGASVGGAALVSYLRGHREPMAIAKDAAVHGAIVGTGLTVAYWVYSESDAVRGRAQPNGIPLLSRQSSATKLPYGRMTAEGINLLSNLDTDKLYSKMNGKGVKVLEEPPDPHVVDLPKE